ncbi:MAG TPA: glycosyltransferase family protein [Saprospiraceae bacterium]|nr:glycosyltransferase family protein [Saprospiraceae bacterium]
MKIFYAVQANGNGHISRAIQILPYLKKYGEVDLFLSGNNTSLTQNIPIKYRSNGVNLFYKDAGGLDYYEIFKSIPYKRVIKEANELPVNNYDLVINDFDFITSLACKIHKKPSVHFGHQASFQSKLTPRSKANNPIGKIILQKFVKSSDYVGLHFKSYDKDIYNPIIKDEIVKAKPTNEEHISVYLPQYSISFLEPFFLSKNNIHFEIFTREVSEKTVKLNITYFPINNTDFTNSLITCNGIITAGGFETPAEAMYLKKKLLSIPINNHFEQECNAEALKQLGVNVVQKIDAGFNNTLDNWLKHAKVVELNLTHSTERIIEILMEKC